MNNIKWQHFHFYTIIPQFYANLWKLMLIFFIHKLTVSQTNIYKIEEKYKWQPTWWTSLSKAISTCCVMDRQSTIKLICNVVGFASSLCIAKAGNGWEPLSCSASPKSTTSFMEMSTSNPSQTKAGVPEFTFRCWRLPFPFPRLLW